jgi:hypothetical protein
MPRAIANSRPVLYCAGVPQLSPPWPPAKALQLTMSNAVAMNIAATEAPVKNRFGAMLFSYVCSARRSFSLRSKENSRSRVGQVIRQRCKQRRQRLQDSFQRIGILRRAAISLFLKTLALLIEARIFQKTVRPFKLHWGDMHEASACYRNWWNVCAMHTLGITLPPQKII